MLHFGKSGKFRLKPSQTATIFNVVSVTRTHLVKIGAICHVVPTCHDMSAKFPAKGGGGGCEDRYEKKVICCQHSNYVS